MGTDTPESGNQLSLPPKVGQKVGRFLLPALIAAACCLAGCVGRSERDVYAELVAQKSDGDRQPIVWELRPEFSRSPASKAELDAIARYYRDYPDAAGTLKLGILFTLGDYLYDDAEFCEWLVTNEGLSRNREKRGYAWFYFHEYIKYKAREEDMRQALDLSYRFPGIDVDGSTRSPDKMCISQVRELGELHYPSSTWWKER